MKFKLLLSILSSICLIGFTQNEEYLIDTSYNYFWDESINDWSVSSYSTNLYDSTGKVSEIKNGSWSAYTNTWREYLRENYYDSESNLAEDLYYYWDTDSNGWVNTSRNTYVYDSAGNLTGHFYYGRDPYTNEWHNQNYYLFKYDSAGNQIAYYYHFWSVDSNDWFNSSYSLRLYDSAGNRVEMDSWTWNPDSNDWMNLNHYEYQYDSNGNLKEYFRSRWETDRWAKTYKYLYDYDLRGNTLEFQLFIWEEESSDWLLSSYGDYSYDSKGKLHDYTVYYWDSGVRYWRPDYQRRYVYKPLAGAHMDISPPKIDFGKHELKTTSSEKQFSLKNSGTENITVTAIMAADSIFSLSGIPALPAVIEPSNSLNLRVDFSPNEAMLYTDTIIVNSDDPDTPTDYLFLSGEGVRFQAADSGSLYLISAISGGALLSSFDPSSGKENIIGPVGQVSLHGISINSEGIIHGINGSSGDIYKIDAGTGTAVLAVKTGIQYLGSLSFGPGDDLYATAEGKLLQVDLSSGFYQQKYIPNYYLENLAWDPSGGKLWSITSYRQILTIDPVSFTVKVVAESGNDNYFLDLAFDFAGNLFGIAYSNSGTFGIQYIDKNSGKTIPTGIAPDRDLHSLAFHKVPKNGAHVRILPDSLDFGIIETGGISDTSLFSITNIGTDDLSISAFEFPDSIFQVLDQPATPILLSSGSSSSFTVVFKPNDPVSYEDTIKLHTDIAGNSILNLHLSGKGFHIENADSGGFYAVTDYGGLNNGKLVKIDPSSGSISEIGDAGNIIFTGLAINSSGYIYGIDYAGTIYKIDASSGTPVSVLKTGLTNVNAITFDSKNILFASSSSGLFKIDVLNKVYESIGYSGYFTGMSFDPLHEILWAMSSYGSLSLVDPESGSSTYYGYVEINGYILDIAFNYSGELFAMVRDYQDNYLLVKVNMDDFQVTEAGKVDINSMAGMDIYKTPRSGKHLLMEPDSIDFGIIELGKSTELHDIMFYNDGTQTTTITNILLPSESIPYAQEMIYPFDVKPGKDTTIYILFEPMEAGVMSGNITVQSNAEEQDLSTYVTGEGFYVDRNARKALYLTDAGDFMQVPNSSTLVPEEFTIEFWFRVHKAGLSSEAGGEQNILDIRGYGGYNFRLAGTSFPLGGHVTLLPDESLGSTNTGRIIDKNVWYHLAFKRKTDGMLVLYLNGEKVGSRSNTPFSANTYQFLRIGEYLGFPANSYGFHGELDDLRIWNYARSITEIQENLSKELTGSEPGLSAYWNFNYEIKGILPGITLNKNDGQLFGNAKLVDSEVPKDFGVHVARVSEENQVLVYPNPFSEETCIRFPNEAGSLYVLTIRDMTGKVVRIIDGIAKDRVIIRREGLATGMYLYELRGSGIFRGKMVIE